MSHRSVMKLVPKILFLLTEIIFGVTSLTFCRYSELHDMNTFCSSNKPRDENFSNKWLNPRWWVACEDCGHVVHIKRLKMLPFEIYFRFKLHGKTWRHGIRVTPIRISRDRESASLFVQAFQLRRNLDSWNLAKICESFLIILTFSFFIWICPCLFLSCCDASDFWWMAESVS